MRLEINGKPVPKGRPRKGENGFYTPKKTKEYEKRVRQNAWVHRPLKWRRDGTYKVEIALFYRDNRKRDVDNVAKAILDGLNKVVWNDDSQVSELSITRQSGAMQNCAIVKITLYGVA